MDELLEWLRQNTYHPLLASCLFHYEFEFFHPFSEGNGRMGRLWQTLILTHWRPELGYLPVETVIKDRQSDYYLALRASDTAADAAPFVSFMLEAIYSALITALGNSAEASHAEDLVKSSAKGSVKSAVKIIALIQTNPNFSAPELAEHLGISVRALEKHLANLKAAGKLRRIGSPKGGHWEALDTL
jgi:Fic family protein